MKVYFPVQDFEPDHLEVVRELKNIFEKQFSGFKADPVLSLTYDKEDQFFLKNQSAFLWGKIFFEPFSIMKAGMLKREHEQLIKCFEHPVHLNVFFGEGELDEQQAINYPVANYFQYSFIQALGEKAMKVEKISILKNSSQYRKNELDESCGRSDYNFFKQSQLTRNELAELIDLSLDLRSLNAV